MTDLGKTALRQLALNAVAQHAGPTAGAEGLAAATRRAYDDLALVSAPLIGRAGVEALTGRALHLSQQEYRWLVHTPGREHAEAPFAQFIFSLERQDPAVATEAAGAVLSTFTGLLVTFIGESLTARLLRKAWPGAFPDAGTKETKA